MDDTLAIVVPVIWAIFLLDNIEIEGMRGRVFHAILYIAAIISCGIAVYSVFTDPKLLELVKYYLNKQ